MRARPPPLPWQHARAAAIDAALAALEVLDLSVASPADVVLVPAPRPPPLPPRRAPTRIVLVSSTVAGVRRTWAIAQPILAACEDLVEIAPEDLVEIAPEDLVEIAPEDAPEIAPATLAEIAPEVEATSCSPALELAPASSTASDARPVFRRPQRAMREPRRRWSRTRHPAVVLAMASGAGRLDDAAELGADASAEIAPASSSSSGATEASPKGARRPPGRGRESGKGNKQQASQGGRGGKSGPTSPPPQDQCRPRRASPSSTTGDPPGNGPPPDPVGRRRAAVPPPPELAWKPGEPGAKAVPGQLSLFDANPGPRPTRGRGRRGRRV